MAVIESYSFGRMVVDGRNFTKDVLIYPDGSILSPWWRISGHRLEMADIEKLIGMHPEVIVAGTGASGLMQPAAELVDALAEQNIEFIVLPTSKALEVFNDQAGKKPTGGCFHLTC